MYRRVSSRQALTILYGTCILLYLYIGSTHLVLKKDELECSVHVMLNKTIHMKILVCLLSIHLTILEIMLRFSRGSKHQMWNQITAKRNLEKNKGGQ